MSNPQKTCIKWIPISERMPTNANRLWEGQPDTPYIPCLVFASYPGKPQGGVIEAIRWDTKNKEWFKSDFQLHYGLQHPCVITHFCDDHFGPHEDHLTEYKRGIDDANDSNAAWNDENY